MPASGRLARLAPPVFVLLWSSGFVVARLVRAHAEPESFLALRFVGGAIFLGAIAGLAAASWPRTARGWAENLFAGVLMQGLYLGAAYWAVKHGLAAGLTALICSLQPLATAVLARPLLGEAITRRQWLGIVVGFLGAALVIVPELAPHAGAAGASAPLPAVIASLAAMLAITLGTIWQKRIAGSADLLAGAAIQSIGAFLVTLPIALASEHGVDNDASVWVGLAWAVVVLSGLTTLLLLGLIKQGAVAEVASLFYLVPAVVALMSFAMFGETLSAVQMAGMAVATLGVFLARQRKAG